MANQSPQNRPNGNNNNDNRNGDRRRFSILTIVIIAVAVTLLFNSLLSNVFSAGEKQVTYDAFLSAVETDAISQVEIQSDRIQFLRRDEMALSKSQRTVYYTGLLPNVDLTSLISTLEDNQVEFSGEIVENSTFTFLFSWVLFPLLMLALLSLLFTPFSYMCAAWMKKPVQRAGAAYKKAASALSAATLDRARNAVTYRIYGCEDARIEKYEEALNTYEKTAVRNNVWQSALPPLYLAASEAGVLFILWFGAKNVLGSGWSTWDIAAFTTFLSCFTKLVVKSSKVAKLFNAVQKAEVSWKRIRPLMKTPEQLDALQIPAAQDVTLKELAFSYGEEPVFSGLSLTAHPGDIIGITGPVACGKSTFGRVFLCEAPYGGSAKFGKTEFAALTPRQISATVGYLGHDPELSADTVQNNVLCGSEQDAMPWLAAAALDDEVLAMENGVDTVIGPSGTRLSGGQAQRLALARTLAHPRPVLILDDPFSALDRHTEDTVFADLQSDAKDKVVFLISHRLYHFPQMQKVIFMDGGKTTVGTHAQLMETVPLYRQLYESQTVQKEGDLDEE